MYFPDFDADCWKNFYKKSLSSRFDQRLKTWYWKVRSAKGQTNNFIKSWTKSSSISITPTGSSYLLGRSERLDLPMNDFSLKWLSGKTFSCKNFPIRNLSSAPIKRKRQNNAIRHKQIGPYPSGLEEETSIS